MSCLQVTHSWEIAGYSLLTHVPHRVPVYMCANMATPGEVVRSSLLGQLQVKRLQWPRRNKPPASAAAAAAGPVALLLTGAEHC